MPRPVEARVDVLVVGAGPAGWMCANALARTGINVKIIDRRKPEVPYCQADSIQSRSVEMLQSYGLAEPILREAAHVYMSAFYNPGRDGGLECTGRVPVMSDSCARYPFEATLRPATIERIFLDALKNNGVSVDRSRRPSAIEISEDPDELSSASSYPVKVTVERLDAIEDDNKMEVVYAKFVVGADGAHSWVRKALGIEMQGEQTDYIWGVLDMVIDTNFPDIRNRTAIHSTNGSAMIIPREGDSIRLYIQLSDQDVMDPSTRRVDKNRITPEVLISIARKIFYPYELSEPKEIEWWTIYFVGQRVASSFSCKDRVFIAGDACHTHSPKAGQGMNASMNDAHNLAWKLTLVLRGWANLSILKTYEHERRKYAQDLISFDKELANLFSTKPHTADNEDRVFHERLFGTLQRYGRFASGIGIQYSPCAVVESKHQRHAEELIIGGRMHSQEFVRAADIRPINIQDMLPADARFKVLFFVGDLTETKLAKLNVLAAELSKPTSFMYKYGADGDNSAVFDVITITSGQKYDTNYLTVPVIFRPHWSKVLLDDTDVTGTIGGRAYDKFGIDPSQITVVVVRPDGFIGTIVPATTLEDLDNYFISFLTPCGIGSQQRY